MRCIALSPDEKTFASISVSPEKFATLYICDSETGHCISGPFEFKSPSDGRVGLAGCFSPDGKHILVKFLSKTLSCHAVVWNIDRGEEVFQLEGFDFVFIHCGRNKGRIASMYWIDDKSEYRDPRSTRVLVEWWDIGHGISGRLFEITGIAVAHFSPNGQYLAVDRQSENAVELWNLEDGKITHRFLHSPGNLESLYFSPTSDCLMAAFRESDSKCLWRLDTQAMVSFDLDVGRIPPVVFHSPHTNHVFVPRDDTVEIWEVSMTGSNVIFETEPLTTLWIGSICPLRDGLRFLVGSSDKTVRMWNMEDLEGNQPVTQDVDVPIIIAFSPSGKMAATESTCIELRDTATWELVGPGDIEYEDSAEIAFSADDNRIAVFTESLVTTYDVNHPKNRLSFDPWPEGRSILTKRVAFQTCNDLVICAWLKDDDSDELSGLLQVWKLKDHSEWTFSLDINISTDKRSSILLAPDGMTVIFTDPVLCYSWNHAIAKFDRIRFTGEAHLDGGFSAYSPDGKLFACRSLADDGVRIWDTRTGQLCGKPITMPDIHEIALSPVLNDRSLGDRLIALRCDDTNTMALFDAYTGYLYAQFWDSQWCTEFIRDGTKLVSYNPIRIHDIVDIAAMHRNATHGYEPIPRGMRDGWMVGQDNESMFWVPLEHRKFLCLPHVEMIWDRPTKVDLSRFRHGSKWTECIDQEWLKKSTDPSQAQNSATVTSSPRNRMPGISRTQSQLQEDNYSPRVYQPHLYYPPIPTVITPIAPLGVAPHYGYVQSPPSQIAIYPSHPGHPSGQSIPPLPVHYTYPGYPPPAPVFQTSSTARVLSPFRPPATVPPISTPDPSQAQTSATATSPSRTRSPEISQTQTGYNPPRLHQPHPYYPSPPHGPSAPVSPPIYAGYPLLPPSSHASRSGTLSLPPLTVWAHYGPYPPPPPHQGPLPSTSSPQLYPSAYPHYVLPPPQDVRPSHRQLPVFPG